MEEGLHLYINHKMNREHFLITGNLITNNLCNKYMCSGYFSAQSRDPILPCCHIIIRTHNLSMRKLFILQVQDLLNPAGERAVAPAVCQVHVKEAENRNTDIPACNRDDTAHDKGPTQLHLAAQRERERAAPTAAQCPCRHSTNTLPIVSAACSRLCKHPPPQRSVEAIFRPRAGSDFMCNVRLSLPLSGGWTFPAASQTKGERWRTDGVQGLEGGDNTLLAQVIVFIFNHFAQGAIQCKTFFFSSYFTVSLDRESAAASRFTDSFTFFQFGAATCHLDRSIVFGPWEEVIRPC